MTGARARPCLNRRLWAWLIGCPYRRGETVAVRLYEGNKTP